MGVQRKKFIAPEWLDTDLIKIEIHTGFPDLLIEEHSLKIDQLQRDVDTMLGIGDRKLRITLNNVIYGMAFVDHVQIWACAFLSYWGWS